MNEMRELSFDCLKGATRHRLLASAESMIKSVAMSCRHLQTANLLGFYVTETALQAIVDNCPQLTDLYITQSPITDHALAHLSNSPAARSLKRFHLAHCSRITDEGIRALSESRWLQLRCLSLADMSITDAALRHLANPHPEAVVMADTSTGSQGGGNLTFGLGVGGWGRRLSSLALSYTNVTEVGVIYLIHRSSNLNYLHIQGCSQFSDYALLEIVKSSKTLRLLDVAGCRRVTDVGIMDLVAMLQHRHRPRRRRGNQTLNEQQRDRSLSSPPDISPSIRSNASSSPTRPPFESSELSSDKSMKSELCVVQLSGCHNVSLQARRALAACGIRVLVESDFEGEIVEAEVAGEVADKLTLLAFLHGFPSVADFVRAHLLQFLQRHLALAPSMVTLSANLAEAVRSSSPSPSTPLPFLVDEQAIDMMD